MDILCNSGTFCQLDGYNERGQYAPLSYTVNFSPTISSQERAWETDVYYCLIPQNLQTGIQYEEVLTNFAARLLSETIDLDPRIDALVDQHFWELL